MRKGARESAAAASQRAGLADEHHARGYSFRKQGNFAAAIEEYSQAIAVEPHHFKALFNRGFSWDKVRSNDQNTPAWQDQTCATHTPDTSARMCHLLLSVKVRGCGSPQRHLDSRSVQGLSWVKMRDCGLLQRHLESSSVQKLDLVALIFALPHDLSRQTV